MFRKTIMRRLLHWWFLVRRPMTLGVRIVVQDSQGRILLVRHTYVSGWHFPGGGVETGETMEDAARKEVREETGIELAGSLELIGMYFNRHASKRDHVGVYRALEWKQDHKFKPRGEIAEFAFFDHSKLPDGVTAGTLRRIREIYENLPTSEVW